MPVSKSGPRLYTEDPARGARRISAGLKIRGYKVCREKSGRYMKEMGIAAIHGRPKLTEACPAHKKYPYLLRGVAVTRVNQVWSTDITYIPLRHGFVYLTAVMDWYSRYVLSWRLSTTLDARFCIDALTEAIDNYGAPDIFNTDQWSKATANQTSTLKQKAKTIDIVRTETSAGASNLGSSDGPSLKLIIRDHNYNMAVFAGGTVIGGIPGVSARSPTAAAEGRERAFADYTSGTSPRTAGVAI